MYANYHTHTWRCKHATETEREYIEAAIAAGLTELGFSDHTPYPFPDGRTSFFRMAMDQSDGYFAAIRALREEYRGKIDIHVGVEAEYYPDVFPALLSHLRAQGCEYMVLGQHYLFNEEPDNIVYSGDATDEEWRLRQYADQVVAGLETGSVFYVAHPDLLHWTGDAATYERHMRRLCEAAKKADVPLEVNLHGIMLSRHYPSPAFWRIAGEVGNRAILGMDAHGVKEFAMPELEEIGRKLLADAGLVPEDRLPMKPV